MLKLLNISNQLNNNLHYAWKKLLLNVKNAWQI